MNAERDWMAQQFLLALMLAGAICLLAIYITVSVAVKRDAAEQWKLKKDAFTLRNRRISTWTMLSVSLYGCILITYPITMNPEPLAWGFCGFFGAISVIVTVAAIYKLNKRIIVTGEYITVQKWFGIKKQYTFDELYIATEKRLFQSPRYRSDTVFKAQFKYPNPRQYYVYVKREGRDYKELAFSVKDMNGAEIFGERLDELGKLSKATHD